MNNKEFAPSPLMSNKPDEASQASACALTGSHDAQKYPFREPDIHAM